MQHIDLLELYRLGLYMLHSQDFDISTLLFHHQSLTQTSNRKYITENLSENMLKDNFQRFFQHLILPMNEKMSDIAETTKIAFDTKWKVFTVIINLSGITNFNATALNSQRKMDFYIILININLKNSYF